MRGRGIRIVLIVIVVLGGLFVAVDRVALSYAESRAADRIQSSRGLTDKPAVSIKGFPFLTQVLDRNLDEITATINGVQVSGAGQDSLRIERFTADLHHVRVGGDFSSAVAETATATATLSYADLSEAAPPGVAVSYGGTDASGRGQVKVTGSVSIPVLGTLRRSVLSEVQVVGGDTVQLHAESIPGADEIPGLDQLLRGKIDFARRLSGLPAGITLKSVRATPDGIVARLAGTDVRLTG